MTSIPGIKEVIQLYASTVFQTEFDSTPSLNIPLFLPSGIAVKEIRLWFDVLRISDN